MTANPLAHNLSRVAVLFPLALLLMAALVACGSEPSAITPTATAVPDESVTVPPANVVPTSTAVPVPTPTATATVVAQSTATPIPEPTSTPVPIEPTATAVPTPTATAMPIRAATNTPVPPTATALPTTGTAVIPIEVVGASNLGSLQLEIGYDPNVLEFKGVDAGPLADNAFLESNLEAPGRLKIVLIDASGINGDGVIIMPIFIPINQRGTTALTLENVEATDIDIRGLSVQVSQGQFTGLGSPNVPLKLFFLK